MSTRLDIRKPARVWLPPLAAALFTAFASSVQCQTQDVPMKLSSTSFDEGGKIPVQYTADGENISPELQISGVPSAAKSLLIVVEDPDAPKGTLTHWLLWNLQPDVKEILANAPPRDAVQGLNFQGKNNYTGPNPSSGTHHYHFRLFALDIALKLPPHSGRKAVDAAIEGHVLAKAELIGLYTRSQNAKY